MRVHGSAGYFCAGLTDGPRFEVDGNVGWGLADNMYEGSVVVRGNAGAIAGVAIRGADVVVHGNIGSRAGQVMKAGTLCCGGNANFMAGYMMYGGRLVICGDSGEKVGQDIHGGTIYVGGKIASLGTDAEEVELEAGEEDDVLAFLERYEIPFPGTAQEDRQRRQEPPLPAHRAARPGDPVLRRLGADGLLEREGAGGHRGQGADRPLPDPRLRRRPPAAAPERHRVQARPLGRRARSGRRLQGRARDVARRPLRRHADRPLDARDDRAR